MLGYIGKSDFVTLLRFISVVRRNIKKTYLKKVAFVETFTVC